MPKSNSKQVDVAQLRSRLLQLAEKQAGLRERLENYMTANSDTTYSSLARDADIPHNSLIAFSRGERSLRSEKGLKGLCSLLDCVSLGEEIIKLGEAVPDRYFAFASGSPAAITVAMDIMQAQQVRKVSFTFSEFAEAFGPCAETVDNVLYARQSGLQALEDHDIRETIEIMLIDDLDDKLQAIAQRRDTRKQDASRRLQELIEPLAAHYGGKVKLSRILDVGQTTLSDALACRTSLETIETLIELAKKQKKFMPTAQRHIMPPEEVANPPTPPPVIPEGTDVLAAVGGITTEEGVRFVLTASSFNALELDEDALVAVREFLLRVIPLTRLALNIGSQLNDPRDRKHLRGAVGREVEELSTAIEKFTFAHPNRLSELHDSQRQVWASDGTNTELKSTRGKQ